ncbi:hypothetical protein [Lutibacter citreus]|uniref:hypothetical protein n=1 Tax=Lutibacter citreus TaxID=2138210 RepID=UPI000DBE6AD3|nr:hypothetical protein [Lutibacter citreus]
MNTKIKTWAILLLSVITFTTSCTDDDISLAEDFIGVSDDFSSFKWYTSGTKTTSRESEKVINLDTYVGFFDVSENALSHQWTIPESGKFLNKEFTETDSIYDKFIVPSTSLVSNDDLINVLFTEAGVKEVILFDTFKDSVTDAVLVGDYWQVEKVFTIDVFKNTNPECKVFKYDYSVDPENPTLVEVITLDASQDPTEESASSWPTVSIEAGEELVYVDKSTIGRPSSRKFYLNGGKPDVSSKDTAVIKYNKLGVFTANMESSRAGDSIPKYTRNKLIPLNIEVLPSTKPFVIGGNAQLEDRVISFAVTGEAAEAVNQKDFFTVHVTNEAAGFDQNVAIESVSINKEDATLIEIKLVDAVFNTDEIEVSFNGGNIVSVDERVLVDFDAVPVKFDLGENVLDNDWSSYEKNRADFWKSAMLFGYWVGNSNDDNGSTSAPIWQQTDEKVFEGNFSVVYQFDLSKNMTLQGSDFSKPNGIPEGTYRISYMIYLEPGNTMKMFTTAIQVPFQLLEWDIENLPRGEWVEISQVVTTGAIPSGKRFDLKVDISNNPGVSGAQKMYFDAVKWIPLVPRT